MGIIDNYLKRRGYIAANSPEFAELVAKAMKEKYPAILLATAEAQKFDVPDGSLYQNQAELYQRLAWVHMAVNHVASYAASNANLQVKRLRGEKETEVSNQEFEMLMRRPNPKNSRFEFMRATISSILLTGNCFWHINRPDENSKPLELWYLPTHTVRPIGDGKSFIRGYAYDPGDGQEIMLEPWQILHFMEFHPNSIFMGLSRVEPIAVDATADMQMSKWNARLFGENNARLPGILAFAELINDTAWDQIKGDIKEASANREQMMLRGVGEKGVQWLQASSTLRDMEFINGRTFTKEEIFNIFAPGLASVLAVNATEANSRTGKATMIEFGVWPMLVAVSEKITNQLMPVYGSGAQITYIAEFEDIRITDRALELQEIGVFAETHTIDEVRDVYYQDKPIAQVSKVKGDQRGALLIKQVSAVTSLGGQTLDTEPSAPPNLRVDNQQPQEPQEQPGEQTGQSSQDADENEAAKMDLMRWQKAAIKRLKEGGAADYEFVSSVIPAGVSGRILAKLRMAKSASDVRRVFAPELADDEPQQIAIPAELITLLAKANELLERKSEHVS